MGVRKYATDDDKPAPSEAGVMTRREWRELKAAFGDCCAYCGLAAKLIPDHIVPRSRGGEHARENIAPVCRSCNSSKGDLLLLEWIVSLVGPCKRMALHRRNPLGLGTWLKDRGVDSGFRYIELRPEFTQPRSGGPEHISTVLARVLDALLSRVEANQRPAPPPPRRPAA